ncbi:MAG: hypothetical protein WAL85_19250 [Candidatus Korobacteraceae bacterium]
MTDWYKYLFNIFEGVEEKEDQPDPFDIEAFGDKVELAKSANIDAMAFFEKRFKDGLSMKEALAAFDAELAKIPPKTGAAVDPAKS